MTRRKFGTSAALGVRLEHRANAYQWEVRPGIEYWGAEVDLTYDDVEAARAARVAAADMWLVDTLRVDDFIVDLDMISPDMGHIADKIDDSEAMLLYEHGIMISGDARLLIVQNATVDRFWRGNRIGPALINYAADALRPDGIFLIPAALHTRLDGLGRCVNDYEGPRGGPEADKKVKAAWRRAGFRKLAEDVVWRNTLNSTNLGSKAQAVLVKVEPMANEKSAKAWWSRRVKRQGPK